MAAPNGRNSHVSPESRHTGIDNVADIIGMLHGASTSVGSWAMLRKFGAFIIAPFPIALFQALVVSLWPKVGKGINAHPSSMFVAICLYFYVVGIVFGFPLLLAIRKIPETPKKYLLVGLFSAIFPIMAVSIIMVSRGQGTTYMITYINLLFGIGGIIAGYLFWRVGIRATPKEGLAQAFN